MKNLDFNAMGVAELNPIELQSIDGGGLWDGVVGYLVEKAIEGLIYCAVQTHESATLFDAPQGVWLWQ